MKFINLKKHNYMYLLVIISIYSCSNSQTNSIYQNGREWLYDVKIYDSKNLLIDNCELELKVDGANLSSILAEQKGITYYYKNCGENNSYKETTGVDENNESIFLHSPRLGIFAFTEVVPFPRIQLPPEVLTYSDIELKVVKSTYKPAQNKVIKQTIERTETDSLIIKGKKHKCYLIEGKNTNYLDELGQFKVIYWFNEKYGFVRFEYLKPDGSTIDIIIKNANF